LWDGNVVIRAVGGGGGGSGRGLGSDEEKMEGVQGRKRVGRVRRGEWVVEKEGGSWQGESYGNVREGGVGEVSPSLLQE